MSFWRVCFALLLAVCAVAYHYMRPGSTSAWSGGLMPFLFFLSLLLILASVFFWLYERLRRSCRRCGGGGDGPDFDWGDGFAGNSSSGDSFGGGDCGGGASGD